MLPDTVVVAHLKWLEMRGHTPASVYARFRALARLLAWLEARKEPVPARATEPVPFRQGGESGSQSGRLWPPGGTQGTHPHYPSLSDPPNGSPPASLLDASAADLAAWRAGLATGPAATVNYISHAREFYAWCVKHGLRADNPAAELPVPRLPRRLPRPVSEPDLMAALASAPARVRPWLVLAGWAGLRAREIALLRRENVLDTRVPPQLLVTADAGKGRRERLVPASAFVLAELRAAGLPARGWVFPRRDGRPGPNAPHLVSQLAGRTLREAGINATLHALRHRFASQLYQQTHDIRLVQEMLGHANPSTTAGYAAYDRTGAASAVDALAAPGRLRMLEGL